MLVLYAALSVAAAEPLIDQGEKLYADGDYLGAVRLLERVVASGTAERTRARLYLAASHFAARDRDAAQRVLVALFADDPAARIEADRFPPPFVQAFEAARPAPAPAEAGPRDPPAATSSPAEGVPPPAPARRASRLGFIPLALGAAAAGVATYFLVRSELAHTSLTRLPTAAGDVISYSQGQELSADGVRSRLIGWALVGVAAAAVITAVALFLFVHAEPSP